MLRLRAMLRPVKAHPVWGALAFASLTLVVLWAFVPQVAQANALENALIQIVGKIVGFFVYILGQILIKFIAILVAVAQFNNFIDAPAVKIGWSVTRDMANMFFIVALLLIAIGTMFRIDQYRYSRTLSKLIIMAILINFSKAIAGLFIDFSQVVMLTFVNAFKDQAAGSLSAGFGIDKLLQLSTQANAATGEISGLSVVGSLFAALVMVFVATVIVAIFTILLIQRIIMLWIYIVLAPTAYMVAVLPGSLGSWWSSWWRDFSQYLIKGPVIAFFLWLALTIITLSSTTLIPTTSSFSDQQNKDLQSSVMDDEPAFVNEATTGTAIINYLVAIGMLIAGLQQATKAGGAAGAVAGKWMGNFNKWGSAIATSPLKGAGAVLKRPAYGTAGAVLSGASKIPLVGGTFGKLNAKLTRHRQKQEDKDSDWVNYADDKTKQRYATSNFALTEAGRIDQKNMRESMIKNNQFRGLKEGQKDEVIESYRGDIGQKMKREYNPLTKKYDGKYYETAADSPGLKVLTDYLNKKSPASMEGALNNASDIDLKTYWKERIEKSVDKMNVSDLNDMEVSDWDVRKHKVFNDLAIPRLETRAGKSDFVKKMNSDGNASILEAINKSYTATTGKAGPLFQEDIDRDRQARTAARVAEFQKRNLNFHESDEYQKNQGQFYDQQSFATNLAQDARRVERENLKKNGVELPITGASSFAKGSEDTLAVSEELLNSEGIRLSAGGTVNDEDKLKLAAALDTKLAQDIADVERDLANAAPEILDSVQEGSGTGKTVRDALKMKLENLNGVRNRIQDTDKLGSMSFINADRYGGNARNILAEEGFHRQIQAMDQDGSFRKELWGTMAPEEQQKIVQQMRDKTKRQDMGEDEAFEEYLAKGLTNLTRETWADTAPDAVKLDSGLALAVQRQSEAAQAKGIKGAKMYKLGMLQPEFDTSIPEKVSPLVAAGKAKVGAVMDKTSGLYRKTTGVLGKATSALGRGVSSVAGAAVRPVTSRVSNAKDALNIAASNRGAKALEKQEGTLLEKRVAAEQTEKIVTGLRSALKVNEPKAQAEVAELRKQYDKVAATAKTPKDPKEAREAAEQMNTIREQMSAKVKDITDQKANLAAEEADLARLRGEMGVEVSKTFEKTGSQAARDVSATPAITRTRAETEKVLEKARAEAVTREAAMTSAYSTLEQSDAQQFMNTVAENPEKLRAQGRTDKATSRGRTTKAGKYQDVADSLQNLSQEQLLQQSIRMDPTARQKILEAGKAQQAYDASSKRVADLEQKLADVKAAEVRASTAAAKIAPPSPPPQRQTATAQTATAPQTSGTPQATATAPARATTSAAAEASGSTEAQTMNVTNITNVNQEINQAFKGAPADVRGKLMGIDSKTLDSALHNSIVWRGLMSYIKNNTAEVQKSEKLGDVGREELQKRIGKLQGHMDEGNAEAFKNEFGELQSMFGGGSSSAGNVPGSSEAA